MSYDNIKKISEHLTLPDTKKISDVGIIDNNELEQNSQGASDINAFRDHTNPKYVGPGTWNVIHRYGFIASDHDSQIVFIKLMKDICNGFPCTICRGHCGEYIKNHPMEEYLDVQVDIDGKKYLLGMFVWSWKFHNAVNTRLRKPIMSWNTAYNLYSGKNNGVCSKDCADADDVDDAPPDGMEHELSSEIPHVPEPQINQKLLNVSEPSPFKFIRRNK